MGFQLGHFPITCFEVTSMIHSPSLYKLTDVITTNVDGTSRTTETRIDITFHSYFRHSTLINQIPPFIENTEA